MPTEDSEVILTNFDQLHIKKALKASLSSMNMVTMTPIQQKCIPPLLKGKDLLGAAKTGSGKTLAFLVPLVQKIMKEGVKNEDGTVALILSPTRELSIQTFKVLEKLIAGTKIRGGVIIGGSNKDEEARYLTQGITVVVATPGRLLDHLNNTKTFHYSKLHTLIIDEADRLMNQGFLEDMRAIVRKLPKERQTVLFSATLNVNSAKLKKKMKKVVENQDKKKLSTDDKVLSLAYISLKESCVCVDMSTAEGGAKTEIETSNRTVSELTANYVVCAPEDRFRLLCTLLKNNSGKKVMVFMSTCMEVRYFHVLLSIIKPSVLPDVPLLALLGKQKQAKREQNLERFTGETRAVMLCTDVAARGLDIPLVDLVVQYDPPEDHKEYLHRVGRTARNGSSGSALIFLRPHELDFVEVLRKNGGPVAPVTVAPSSILPIQEALLKVVAGREGLRRTAEDALKTVVAAYVSNPGKCFDVNLLDLQALAATFGLAEAPKVAIVSKGDGKRDRKRAAAITGMNSDEDNYFVPSAKKNHR